MKPSTILATVLPTLALASPAIKTHAVPQQKAIPVARINIPDPGVLKEIRILDDLTTCLRNHNDFQVDFTDANDGALYIKDVDPACCQKGKDLYSLLPAGQYGSAVFFEPCDGAVVTGISPEHMSMLREFFREITEGRRFEE